MIVNILSNAGLNPLELPFWLLSTAVTALIAASILAARADQRAKRLREGVEQARVHIAALRAQVGDIPELKDDLRHAQEEVRRLEQEAAASAARLAEREAALDHQKTQLEAEFRSVSTQMLNEAHKSFLQRADETFSRHRVTENAAAEQRQQAMDQLIKPMRDTLTNYEKSLAEMRIETQKAQGELTGRISDLAKSAHDVRIEAQKLSSALRAGPKVRGRWGEEQLRNVVELAGMSAHVDFVEQASVDDGERRKQPDMVVSLPGDRVIAVDAKVSLGAYLDAVEADNDAARAAHLERHANDLRAHVKGLASRDYASSFRQSLDFVVMFVPGENYFAAAMEARPELFQEAFDKKILIATPTTLVAILKSAAYGWRQERAAENAVVVAGMAKDLYDSLRKMGAHLSGLGKSLETSVKKYNDLLGGVETRVMPRARKFAEYQLPGIDEPLEPSVQIETAPREPKEGRDLLLPGPDDDADKSAA